MSDITTIEGSDTIRDSREIINQNFENLNDDKLEEADLVTEFKELSDVPNSYEGAAGQVPVVNETEDGLEFQDFPEPEETLPGGSDRQIQYNDDGNFGGVNIEYTDLGDSVQLQPPAPATDDTQGTNWNVQGGDGSGTGLGGTLSLKSGAKEGGTDDNRARAILNGDGATQLFGADAMTGSDEDGRDVTLTPGLGDGSGEDGEVIVNGALRINQDPVSETITPDKTITISLNGTLYKIPVVIVD